MQFGHADGLAEKIWLLRWIRCLRMCLAPSRLLHQLRRRRYVKLYQMSRKSTLLRRPIFLISGRPQSCRHQIHPHPRPRLHQPRRSPQPHLPLHRRVPLPPSRPRREPSTPRTQQGCASEGHGWEGVYEVSAGTEWVFAYWACEGYYD